MYHGAWSASDMIALELDKHVPARLLADVLSLATDTGQTH